MKKRIVSGNDVFCNLLWKNTAAPNAVIIKYMDSAACIRSIFFLQIEQGFFQSLRIRNIIRVLPGNIPPFGQGKTAIQRCG